MMTVGRCVGLLIAVLVLPGLPAAAGDEENEREIEAAEKRVRALLREAEELHEAGRPDEAKRVERKAKELRAAIERSRRHLKERRRHSERDELREILEGLERGMDALRRLERHDELERLERLAVKVRRELAEEERGGRERDREREVAQHQLEIMHIAFEALVKAKRKDGADLMERALHARKVALEGRRDEEARHIRERAPSRGQQVELLQAAADHLREWGRKEQAAAVDKLARQMAGHERRREEGRPHPEHLQEALQRLAQLTERVNHLERVVEELHEQVQALQSERD
jgi:hypothetical protein